MKHLGSLAELRQPNGSIPAEYNETVHRIGKLDGQGSIAVHLALREYPSVSSVFHGLRLDIASDRLGVPDAEVLLSQRDGKTLTTVLERTLGASIATVPQTSSRSADGVLGIAFGAWHDGGHRITLSTDGASCSLPDHREVLQLLNHALRSLISQDQNDT